MANKQAYQEKTQAQLREWQLGLEQLRAKVNNSRAEAKLEYQQQLDELTAKHREARQRLEALKQGSSQRWGELKANLDSAMTGLQQSFDRFKSTGRRYGDDVLSWAKGIANRHNLHSIGWAEGVAKEKETESIGWAEGVAEKDLVESEGWAEGYHKNKK